MLGDSEMEQKRSNGKECASINSITLQIIKEIISWFIRDSLLKNIKESVLIEN